MRRNHSSGRGRVRRGLAAAVGVAALLFAASAPAQQRTPFAGFQHDATQPIQVAADSLEVRNADNVAIFRGDVDVRQGDVRMRAQYLEVRYRRGAGPQTAGGGGAIDRLRARGDVIMTNGREHAQAQAADYDVSAGTIVLTGNVLLLQGENNQIAGERLTIDLATGQARLEGGGGAGGGSGRVGVTLTPERGN